MSHVSSCYMLELEFGCDAKVMRLCIQPVGTVQARDGSIMVWEYFSGMYSIFWSKWTWRQSIPEKHNKAYWFTDMKSHCSAAWSLAAFSGLHLPSADGMFKDENVSN